MDNTLVSIIVPVYNVENYLIKCIESILKQTYTNIEIILIDDGSTDRSGKICDDYYRIDERIQVIHQKNMGLSGARNTGIENAKGNYIIFVDSDDWIEPILVETALMDAQNNDADIVIFGYQRVDDDNNLLLVSNTHSAYKINRNEAVKKILLDEIENYAWNKLYRREVFDNVRYPIGKYWEDIGTTYLVFHNAKKIYVTNRVLYNYLIRKDSITESLLQKGWPDIFLQKKQQYDFATKYYPDCTEKIFEWMVISALAVVSKKKKEYLNHTLIYQEALEFLQNNKREISKEYDNNTLMYYYDNKFLFYTLMRTNNWFNKTQIGQYCKKQILRIVRRLKRRSHHKNTEKELIIQNTRKRCFLIGVPEHQNLGDHAIAVSTIQYLNDVLPEYEIIQISEEDYWKYALSLANNIKEDDYIVLQGGGNIGDIYLYIENIRRSVIRNINCCRIIIMPQTIYFSNTSKGKREYKKTLNMYNDNSNLLICAREKYSYEIMKKGFYNNQIRLLPDIVLRYKADIPEMRRRGILFCMRADIEGIFGLKELQYIKEQCMKYDTDIRVTDTYINYDVSIHNSKKEVDLKIQQFASAKLIITDRLHGMILAALAHTPCIVFSNSNYKVKGVYEWIKELNYIEYIDEIKNIDTAINKLLNIKEKDLYPYEKIKKEYNVNGPFLEE